MKGPFNLGTTCQIFYMVPYLFTVTTQTCGSMILDVGGYLFFYFHRQS